MGGKTKTTRKATDSPIVSAFRYAFDCTTKIPMKSQFEIKIKLLAYLIIMRIQNDLHKPIECPILCELNQNFGYK